MSQFGKHEEIKSLLGAYALDGVEPHGATTIDAHLLTCAECRQEVDEYRGTAALLGSIPSAAPQDLWARIEHNLGVPEAPPFPLDLALTKRSEVDDELLPARRLKRRYQLGAIAAVVALVAGLLVTNLVSFGSGETNSTRVADLAMAANSTPGARHLHLASADGSLHVHAVMLTNGQGYVIDGNLPRLAEGQSYQLWAFSPGSSTPISAGVLGGRAKSAAFVASRSTQQLAITAETADGAAAPTGTPLVSGTVTDI